MPIPPEKPPATEDPQDLCATSVHREPFMFDVAANLHRVRHLPRDQHLDLWRRVVELYSAEKKGLPEFLRNLCQEEFVESLMHNEVFWSLAGSSSNRTVYSQADSHLSAVYAVAALLAAQRDRLPLGPAERALLPQRP